MVSVRFLGMVLIALLVQAGDLWALEPVATEYSLDAMVKQVVRGESIVPGAKGESGPREKSTDPSPVAIHAVGSGHPWSLAPLPAAAKPGEGRARAVPARVRQRPTTPTRQPLTKKPLQAGHAVQALPAPLENLIGAPLESEKSSKSGTKKPKVRARALYCLDCTSNKVVLAKNVSEPLPIASITKLLTAMTVIDEMNLNRVVTIPKDIRLVPQKRVGIRPGDQLTVKDLLHGMLIESGNDCAEALARAYPKGGKRKFMELMNRKAASIGAESTKAYTPSGLDLRITVGRKDGEPLVARRSNIASAEDVARIARKAFTYPLIQEISSMKRYVMRSRKKKWRNYVLNTNDRLLNRPLPVAGAKTGYTNLAGRCIVAMFKDDNKDYLVVVLNSPRHFNAAERIYRWAVKAF